MYRSRRRYLAVAIAALFAAPVALAQQSEQKLPEVKVRATAEPAPGARRYPDEGYAAQGATAGSRVELPLKDVPQSITVIDQELLQDLAPVRLNQVADYVANVSTFGSAATPHTNAFFFRGFGSSSVSAFNGYRDSGFLTTQSLVNLERIEFLKGPASVLYGGSAGLAGLVNFVSKRPQAAPMREVTVGAGSFERFYTNLDMTGPVTEDQRLRYRLTASFDRGGHFTDDYDQESRFISPYLSWDLTPRTQLDLELIAHDTEFSGRENFFPRHPVGFEIPVTNNLGPGGVGEARKRAARIDLKHRLENGWLFRQGFYVSDMDKPLDVSFQFRGVNPDGVTGTRQVRSVPEFERDRASQTELSGKFTTGAWTHDFLAGVEVARKRFVFDFFTAPYTDVDLFNPQPGTQTGPFTECCDSDSRTDTRALYLQDLVDLTGGFKLMLGGRFDEVEQVSRPRGGTAAPGDDIKDDAFSPRVGLIFQPTSATAWYASYSESFSPQFGLSRTGARFDPQEGKQAEVGVKHDLRPGLSATAALFEFTRRNVLTSDPVDSNFDIAVGEQRSRGFELELAGRVTADYSVVASYGYLDAEVTEDNSLPVGDKVPGVPEHSIGVFNKLRLTALGAPEWSATLGVVYVGERESGLPNDTASFTSEQLRIPSYTQVDLGLVYETRGFTVRLAGTNLTDEKVYDSQGSILRPRAPRAFHASVAAKF